jgi:choline dehydrogenase-like flavoprotein
MSEARHYAVVITGADAGGATLTRRPAPSAKRVLLLERGSRHHGRGGLAGRFDRAVRRRHRGRRLRCGQLRRPPAAFGRRPASARVGAVAPDIPSEVLAHHAVDHIVERLQ